MSNFTYEIDERNLRLQMKEFTVPVKEDAWQKFETFSGGMVSQQRESGLKGINLSLNRNVVLPSVFGVVIILFSFLLVNFVSIKNTNKEVKAEVSALPVNEPKPVPAAQKVISPTRTEAKPEVKKADVPAVAEVKAEEPPPATVPETLPETSSTQAVIAAEPSTDSLVNEDAKAKRRAERRAARAAEAAKLNEIKPTPIAEDSNTEEVRPD